MTQFQQSVNMFYAIGVPGEVYRDGPLVASSWQLESNGTANIIGATAYTITSQGVVTAGGTGIFAGILANPKTYATAGVIGNALGPTMTLPDGTQGELVTAAPAGFVVSLPASANIGDKVIFNNTTGAISTLPPATAVPSGSTLIAGATVVLFTVAGAGLGVIAMTGQI